MRRRTPLSFEPLEARVLLAADAWHPFWWTALHATGRDAGGDQAGSQAIVRDAPDSGDLSQVTSNLTGGVLVVRGTQGDDAIQVKLKGGNIKIDGSFALADVKKIVVVGDAGNDTINVAGGITKKTLIYGNQGNDTLNGGGGADQVFGGPGDDALTGNVGADSLWGGLGNDTLNGDAGDKQVDQGSPNKTSSQGTLEDEIVTLTNQERANDGKAALAVDPQLVEAARIQAAGMAKRFKQTGDLNLAVDHNLWGVSQPTLLTRIDFVGFEWTSLAENVAGGYTSAQDVVDAWMNSAGHRANILSTSNDLIGVGTASHNGTTFYVQVFGNSV